MKSGSRNLDLIPALLFAIFIIASGCSESSAPSDGGDGGTDTGPAAECTWVNDCPKGECSGGKCVATPKCRCDGEVTQCWCSVTGPDTVDCRPMQICYANDFGMMRWIHICQTDLDCPAEGWCHQGICKPYTFKIDQPAPGGAAKTALRAGYGEVPLDFPVGVSMAGFAARSGPSTPYAALMGGSTGFFDRPVVKAFVLDNGAERIVFLRGITSWSTDYINTMVAKKLADDLGANYINKIVTSNFHTHSYPARFWTAAYGTGLGSLGCDDYNFEIFDRITTSYVAAIKAAVNNLAGAKLAYAYDLNFDPDNQVIVSRNDDTFGVGNKDKTALVMRLDYADGPNAGKTISVLMRYATHGTHMGEPKMTGDAAGMAEIAVERGFEKDLGYHVPVIFFNGNEGNTEPAPDGFGDYDPNNGDWRQRYSNIQLVARRLYPMIRNLYQQSASNYVPQAPDMKVVSTFIPVGRQTLGYTNDEYFDWQDNAGAKVKNVYWNGAFNCAMYYRADGWKDGDLRCLMDMDVINNGVPLAEFGKLRTSAVRIGNLVLVFLPGESVTDYGKDIISKIRTQTGLTDVITVGLAQDHGFYLLGETDWLKGSYESSMDIWGWKFGPLVEDYCVSNAAKLKDVATAKDSEDAMKHSWYLDILPKDSVTPTAAPVEPAVFMEPTDTLVKQKVAVVKWHGGHPGTGTPRIFLEANTGGAWATVKTGGSFDYDDTHNHMIVTYLGNYKGGDKANQDWQAYWEEVPQFKNGTYRFRIEGFTWDAANSVSKPYTIRTKEAGFELTGAKIVVSKAVRDGSDIVVRLRYEPPPYNPSENPKDIKDPQNCFRVASTLAPITLGAPLDSEPSVTVHAACGAQTPYDGQPAVAVSAGTEALTGTNGKVYNVKYTSISFPDFAEKTCEYQITVTDQWGNSGSFTGTIP